MADLSATSTLRLNEDLMALNDGWPAYDVCRIGTTDVIGQVKLGPDDRWRVVGAELDSWELVVDAVRMIMSRAEDGDG